jgi:flagellar motor switch protein FliN/FliY
MTRDDVVAALEDEVVQVSMVFSEGLSGEHFYIIPQSMAISISGLMMGQEGVELNDAALSALQEALSQVSGPVITALGDKIKGMVMTNPAEAALVGKDSLPFPDGEFAVVTYPLVIEGEAPTDILEVYSLEQIGEVVSKGAAAPVAGKSAPKAPPSGSSGGMGRPGGQPQGGQMMDPGMMGGMGQGFGTGQGFGMPAGSGGGMGMNQPNVQSVQFPNLHSGNLSAEHGNISLLMDVYMEMTVELGRTKKLIKEILGMGEGTIIELDKLAGEPVDILVNHKLIAKGEVVVIDENFGVRVTEIVTPMERMKDLT